MTAATRPAVTPWPDRRPIGVDDLEFIGRRTFIRRTWSAQIRINGRTYDTPLSEYDLKRAQFSDAILDAAGLMGEIGADVARVTVFKTTKAHGKIIDTWRTVTIRSGRIMTS